MVKWGDEPVEDTVAYTWGATRFITSSQGADADFILRDTSTATRTMRRTADGELVYRFDLSDMDAPYFEFTLAANYLLEASADDSIYHAVARYDGEPTTAVSNRTIVRVYPDELDADKTLYVRLRSSESIPSYGGAVFDLTICQKQKKFNS